MYFARISAPLPDRVWWIVLLGAQSAWFCVRWILGGNVVDGALVTILAGAAITTGAVLFVDRPVSAPSHSSFARIALFAFGFEVAAALLQPRQGWDERFVLDAASTFAQHGLAGLRTSYAENAWLATRHPPFGIVAFGAAFWAAGGEILGLRLFAGAVATGTVLATAHVARSLYGHAVGERAAWLLLSFPLFVRLGCAVMTDVVVTFLVTMAVALAVSRVREGGGNAGVVLGLLLGLAVLTKYTAIVAAPIVFVIYALHGVVAERRSELAVTAFVGSGIVLAWLGAAYEMGGLATQVGWLQDAAAVSSGGLFGPFSAGEMLISKLPSALGLYTLPAIAAGLAAMTRRGGPGGQSIALWIAFVCIPLLLTLPDNRYFLLAFPAFAIAGARGIGQLFQEPDRSLRFFVALCFWTVVFYAVMPDSRPVYFFESLTGVMASR